MKVSLHFNDDKLKFNEKTQQYELTLEVVKNNFENVFNNDGILQSRISKNSRNVYNYIYSHSYSGNRKITQFFLNETLEGRDFIFDALFSQMEADIESGYNSMLDQPTIDFKSGSVINRNEVIKNQVSVSTENILLNSMGYFGFNVVYAAPYPLRVMLLYKQICRGIKNDTK